jgi:hypothetical protein
MVRVEFKNLKKTICYKKQCSVAKHRTPHAHSGRIKGIGAKVYVELNSSKRNVNIFLQTSSNPGKGRQCVETVGCEENFDNPVRNLNNTISLTMETYRKRDRSPR